MVKLFKVLFKLITKLSFTPILFLASFSLYLTTYISISIFSLSFIPFLISTPNYSLHSEINFEGLQHKIISHFSHTHTHTHNNTHTQIHKHTHSNTQTQTHSQTHTNTNTYTQTHQPTNCPKIVSADVCPLIQGVLLLERSHFWGKIGKEGRGAFFGGGRGAQCKLYCMIGMGKLIVCVCVGGGRVKSGVSPKKKGKGMGLNQGVSISCNLPQSFNIINFFGKQVKHPPLPPPTIVPSPFL